MMKNGIATLMIASLILAIAGCSSDKKNKPRKQEHSAKGITATVGYKAPDFTLHDEVGIARTLSAMQGKKLVLYFYPKDDTPGCTKQACSLRDGFKDLQAAGITIWGISYDSPESHRAFKEKYHLPFSLLSDTDKAVSKLYDADGWLMPKRITVLIDEEGTILAILKDIDVSGHAGQILEAFSK